MNDLLKNVLISSYKNSEYYYDLYKKNNLSLEDLLTDENFKKIPILTRSTVVNEFEKILHKDYKYLKRKQLYLIQTSGSSGNFVDVLWEPREYLNSNLSLWRKRNQWYGISPKHKKCSFVSGTTIGSTITGNNNNLISMDRNTLDLSVLNLSDDTMEKYYHAINSFKPDWIYTPQSALMLFIEFCIKKGYRDFDYLKYIELATEQVLPSTYQYIKNFFNVPISIMYGSKEVNAIAISCPERNSLHILDDNVYVEQTPDNRILVTSLKNTVFPIIRYDLGDIVRLSNRRCKCNNVDIIIDEIKGRQRTLNYVTQNGITTSAVINCIFVVNARLDDPFVQYKLIETPDKIIIRLVLKHAFSNWKESIKDELINCLKNYGITCDMVLIEFYDKPFSMDENTGKLKLLERVNDSE